MPSTECTPVFSPTDWAHRGERQRGSRCKQEFFHETFLGRDEHLLAIGDVQSRGKFRSTTGDLAYGNAKAWHMTAGVSLLLGYSN